MLYLIAKQQLTPQKGGLPLIRFERQPTGKCKKYVQTREAKNGLRTCAILMGLFGSRVMLTVMLFSSMKWQNVLWISLVIMALIMAAVYFFPFRKRGESAILPSLVVIHDDGTMDSKSEKFYWIRSTDEVDHVEDMGEWYQIVFIPTAKNMRFICQKDLMTRGSIREFEEIFAGKIVRK